MKKDKDWVKTPKTGHEWLTDRHNKVPKKIGKFLFEM